MGWGGGYANNQACTELSNLRWIKAKVTDEMYEIIVVHL